MGEYSDEYIQAFIKRMTEHSKQFPLVCFRCKRPAAVHHTVTLTTDMNTKYNGTVNDVPWCRGCWALIEAHPSTQIIPDDV